MLFSHDILLAGVAFTRRVHEEYICILPAFAQNGNGIAKAKSPLLLGAETPAGINLASFSGGIHETE